MSTTNRVKSFLDRYVTFRSLFLILVGIVALTVIYQQFFSRINAATDTANVYFSGIGASFPVNTEQSIDVTVSAKSTTSKVSAFNVTLLSNSSNLVFVDGTGKITPPANFTQVFKDFNPATPTRMRLAFISQLPDAQLSNLATFKITIKGLAATSGTISVVTTTAQDAEVAGSVNGSSQSLAFDPLTPATYTFVGPTGVPTPLPSTTITPTNTPVPTTAPTNTPTPLPTNIPTTIPTNIPTPTRTPTPVPPTPTRTPTPVQPTTVPPTSTPTPLPSWTTCSTEGGTCSFSGTMMVRYGDSVSGSYYYRQLSGGTDCANTVFGDPIPGTVKTCWYQSSTTAVTSPGMVWCAGEGDTCSFTGTKLVRYGSIPQGAFVYKTLTGGTLCANTVFGDPIPGVHKVCYYQDIVTPSSAPTPTPGGATSWTNCAFEGGTCSFSGTMMVRYGANNSYYYRQLTGGTACANTVFGDPIPGTVKSCDYQSVTTAVISPGMVWCAGEGDFCTFSGTHQIRYGANGSYIYKTLTNGTPCANTVFSDPIPGVYKTCYYQ